MIDIADREQLVQYILTKNMFASADAVQIQYFSGGISGTVALVSDQEKSILIKQALPALKVKDVWECDPSRIITEHKGLEVYAKLVPEYVPRPLFCDEEQYIIGREAAPIDCSMWKEQLLQGILDFQVAEHTIRALGRIHNESAEDPDIKEAFENTGIFYDLRINPYIEHVVGKYPSLRTCAEPMIRRLLHEKIALVHGDFSPKNILVSDEKIYILDFEVAHFGHPSFDLAFFFNHFMLKAVKNKQWAAAYCNMLLYMADMYFSGLACMDAGMLEKQSVELLAFMLLARVDGKSPAEYITQEQDRETIRRMGFALIREKAATLQDATALLQAFLGMHKQEEYQKGVAK